MSKLIPARGLQVEIIHGGDAAGHQRRIQEWLEAMAHATIVELIHTPYADGNSRTGVGFSTLIVYTEPEA